jgi:hypothetical protein
MAITATTFSWQNVRIRWVLTHILTTNQIDGFIMSSNRWDEIELDSMILPQFSPKQKERLKHAGYLG